MRTLPFSLSSFFLKKTFSIPLRFNVKSKNNVFHVFYFLSFHFLSSFFLHSFTLFFLRFVITRIKQQLLIPSPVPSSPHVSTLLSLILTSLQFKFVPFFSNNYNNNYFNWSWNYFLVIIIIFVSSSFINCVFLVLQILL